VAKEPEPERNRPKKCEGGGAWQKNKVGVSHEDFEGHHSLPIIL